MAVRRVLVPPTTTEFASKLVATVPITSSPRAIATSLDFTRAYVSIRNSNRIAVIDALALQQIDVDASTPQIDDILLPPGASAFRLAADPKGRFLYVSDERLGTVYVVGIDPGSTHYHKAENLKTGLAAPHGLRGLAASSSGKRLYVTAPGATTFGPGQKAKIWTLAASVSSRPTQTRLSGKSKNSR